MHLRNENHRAVPNSNFLQAKNIFFLEVATMQQFSLRKYPKSAQTYILVSSTFYVLETYGENSKMQISPTQWLKTQRVILLMLHVHTYVESYT